MPQLLSVEPSDLPALDTAALPIEQAFLSPQVKVVMKIRDKDELLIEYMSPFLAAIALWADHRLGYDIESAHIEFPAGVIDRFGMSM